MNPGHGAAVQDGRSVEQRLADARRVGLDKPDDDHGAADRPGHDVQRAQPGLDERGAFQQVHRRVAGDREFGEQHDVAGAGAQVVQRAEDATHVAFEIADRRVDLSDADSHAANYRAERGRSEV